MSKLSLSVTPTAKPARPSSAMTGPGDLRDQHWLDDQVEAIETGVEAVVNIARNWTDGRNLSRLHPGVSAAEYVTARVGTLGKAVVPVLLAESNWSNRQIAAVAGVDQSTVYRARVADATPEPRPVLGADGKTYAPRTVVATVIDTPTPRTRAIAARAAAMDADPAIAESALLRAWAEAMYRLSVLVSYDPSTYVPRLDRDDLASIPGQVASARRWLDSIEAAHASATSPRIVGGAS